MSSPELHRDSGKTLRAPVILRILGEDLPDARIALSFTDRWQLLVATILSAQATDKKVNELTPALFERFPDPPSTAGASLHELEQSIASLGLFRQKARSIQGCARLILERHGGEVPGSMEELTALPGVARKTANVVLSNGFGVNVGVVVDTHVSRIAQRLRLTRQVDPTKIERDLMRLVPSDDWLQLSDLFIHHGRRTCLAQRPRCDDCSIEALCPSSQVAGRRDKFQRRSSRT